MITFQGIDGALLFYVVFKYGICLLAIGVCFWVYWLETLTEKKKDEMGIKYR